MSTRHQSLDVLRGVAVLLVILHHSHALLWGWIGVDLFFVLSGFLISGLLFAELQSTGRISVGRFLVRRGFKIYPSFYAYLIVTSVAIHYLQQRGLETPNLPHYGISEITFLQNYILLHSMNDAFLLWLHTWSLAVEEHFYLLLPVLLVFLARIHRVNLVLPGSAALAIICFVLRIGYLHSMRPPSVLIYESHLRFDDLFAGVALGYIWNFRRERFVSRWWFLPLGCGFLVPSILLPKTLNFNSAAATSGVLTANLIGLSLIVGWAVTRQLRLKSVAYVGRYSYSIYLWQMPVCIVLASWHTLFSVVACVIVCLVAGIAMGMAIELPALALRDRMIPSSRKSTHQKSLQAVAVALL